MATDDAATPYDEGLRVVPHYRFAAVAAAGLYTTAADLVRLAMASASPELGGGVLRASTMAAMESQEQPEQKDAFGHGLGYAVLPLPRGGQLVGHTGSHAFIAGSSRSGRAMSPSCRPGTTPGSLVTRPSWRSTGRVRRTTRRASSGHRRVETNGESLALPALSIATSPKFAGADSERHDRLIASPVGVPVVRPRTTIEENRPITVVSRVAPYSTVNAVRMPSW